MQVQRLTRDRIDDMLKIKPREQIELPTEEVCVALADQPFSWIAYGDDGGVVAALGGIPMSDPAYFRCWAFLDSGASTRSIYRLHSWVERLLRRADFRRLEITVQEQFDAGLVWPSRLGFEVEGTMRRYDAQGNDHYLLALVK